MDILRLALIGAGSMANSVHYPSLEELPGVELSALCDLVEEKLNRTGERFGIEDRYTDYEKMLEEVKPDAVYVITPPHQLFDIAMTCLSRGLDLFTEKPPGVTTFQCRRLAIKAEENECLTMVGFNRRYIPLLDQVVSKARSRGRILHGVATFYKNMIGSPPYYNGSVDMLTCDMIHAVDALRWFCGEPTSVKSTLRCLNADYENAFNALMEFESGATGVLMSNWSVGSRIHRFEVHSKGFSATINPNTEAEVFDGSREAIHISTEEAAGSDQYHKFYGFFGENAHFIESLRENKMPMTNLKDATRTMELVDRIRHSQI